MFSFSSCFMSQILTDFDQVNIRITVVIFPDEHLLKQLSFTWFSINHVLVSNLIIRIFWGALLSLFLSGGMIFISHLLRSLYFFISQSALHCIALYVRIISRHIIGDIERQLIFRSCYVSICCTVIKISLIYITSIRISSYKYQHLHQMFAQFESLNEP